MGFDAMDVETIWMDGEFIDWEEATVHVLTHALHYGSAVFEGARCYATADGPTMFRWTDHLERLYDSARQLGLTIPYDRETLTAATRELIDQQDLAACYIRPLVFYGYDTLGLNPKSCPVKVVIACWPMGSYFEQDGTDSGLSVCTSSWRKYSSSQIPTTMKTTGGYVNGLLAGNEARRDGFDSAVLLNKEGNVAEGPGANLFLVDDGRLFTPAIAEGVLRGITRNTIVRIARDEGYPVADDATISRGELYLADEAFFVGTAAEVTPIETIDGMAVGDGGVGPVTREIRSRFDDVVHRRVDAYEDWFEPV